MYLTSDRSPMCCCSSTSQPRSWISQFAGRLRGILRSSGNACAVLFVSTQVALCPLGFCAAPVEAADQAGGQSQLPPCHAALATHSADPAPTSENSAPGNDCCDRPMAGELLRSAADSHASSAKNFGTAPPGKGDASSGPEPLSDFEQIQDFRHIYQQLPAFPPPHDIAIAATAARPFPNRPLYLQLQTLLN